MNLDSEILQVSIDDIIPNRFQPRLNFDEKALNELAASIKEHGVIQPLVLRKTGDKYEIIAGERRYKASCLAGLQTVPAIISNIDDNTSAEVAIVENLQRKNLTAIEEAKSYQKLLNKGYLTQEQLAKKMGISQSAVANKLRLLNLDEDVQNALLTEKISERHARSLLALKDHNEQRKMLQRVLNERLTVRQLDAEIRKLTNPDSSSDDIPLVKNLNPNIEAIQNNAADLNNNENSEIRDTKEEINDNSNKFFNFLDSLDSKEEKIDQPNIKPLNTQNIFETQINVDENPESLDEETLETLSIEEQKETNDNFDKSIKEIRNLVDKLKNHGLNINIDEIDFNNMYQIILKISK